MPKGIKKVFLTPLDVVADSDLEGVGTRRFEGDEEYVWAKGVASTAKGSWVQIAHDYTTALCSASATTTPKVIGVAMAAILANKFGWYCRHGLVSALSAASNAAGAQQYLTATAGVLDDAVVASDVIMDAHLTATVGGAQALAVYYLEWPSFNPLL